MIEESIYELDDGRIQINEYRIKRIRCHHKNGYTAVIGERISTQILDRDTYIKQYPKGLAKLQNEVLP